LKTRQMDIMKSRGRACPVCKRCGGKKFAILEKSEGIIVVECKYCYFKMEI
jgi:hypothetical protein